MTTAETAELAAWLRAQVETDRAAALRSTPGPWSVSWHVHTPDPDVPVEDRLGCARVTPPHAVDPEGGQWLLPDVARDLTDADATHVMLHDPAQVVARCDADLALIAEVERRAAWVGVLGFLARGYRRREGWKPEWLAA